MALGLGVAGRDGRAVRVGLGDAVCDGHAFGVGACLPVGMGLARDVRSAVRLALRLRLGEPRAGVACQGPREHQRQRSAEIERAVPGLPGGPGGGVFGQTRQHPAGVLHGKGRQDDLQQEVLFDLGHAAHDEFVLLQGVFLGCVPSGREQRGQVRLPAAGVLARVRVSDRQDPVRHLEQGLADPFREDRVERPEAHLGIGGGHGRFE
ncbi:MAG: hypothetical protein ABSB41_02270 [Anaerolineales bacterium]